MNQKQFVASIALAAGLVLTGCSSEAAQPDSAGLEDVAFDQTLHDSLPQQIRDAGTISIGSLWETPPYIGVEASNSSVPIGIVPDLGSAVGKILGVDVDWKNLQWPAQLPGLQSGNVDVLWGQISDGAERERSVADIVGTFQDPIGVLLPAGNPKEIARLAEACGARIAVPLGGQQQAAVAANSESSCAAQGKPKIEAVEFPSAQAALVALRAGSVDGWMDSSASLDAFVEQTSGAFMTVVLPAEEVDPYIETITGAAVSKSSPELSQALLAAMRSLVESGKYQEVLDNWNAGVSALPLDRMQINLYSGTPAGQTP
ncbi:transporter substrate-binding domain-containing protein (plasmid) [Rhodococcus globerulus]|uniref:transporter substrate-binding domain-containing protein n=1 Tax=Rhodococcus globerulus TaxID=33008 RepID=UPI0039E7B439